MYCNNPIFGSKHCFQYLFTSLARNFFNMDCNKHLWFGNFNNLIYIFFENAVLSDIMSVNVFHCSSADRSQAYSN